MTSYTPKVDALLEHADYFEESDFLDLAMAALDQGGVPAEAQERLRAEIATAVAIEIYGEGWPVCV